jgi:hypothetical protein
LDNSTLHDYAELLLLLSKLLLDNPPIKPSMVIVFQTFPIIRTRAEMVVEVVAAVTTAMVETMIPIRTTIRTTTQTTTMTTTMMMKKPVLLPLSKRSPNPSRSPKLPESKSVNPILLTVPILVNFVTSSFSWH